MQQAQAKDEWLRGVKCIADFLGVGERTVWRWMADVGTSPEEGGFPVYRVGGRWVAHTADLRRWRRMVSAVEPQRQALADYGRFRQV